MKRLLCAFLIAAIVLPLAGCTSPTPQPTVVDSPDPVTQIENFLTTESKYKKTLDGIILIAMDGKVLLHKAYGMADIENQLPMTVDTFMPVLGRNHELWYLTPITILLLEDQGRLSLEDSVCPFVPDCPKAWEVITIRDVLRSSSGLPDPFEGLTDSEIEKLIDSPTSLEESVALIRDKPLVTIQGPATSHYSWANTALQIRIVSKILGDTPEDYLTKNLFEPLGIASLGKEYTGTAMATGQKEIPPVSDQLPVEETTGYPAWMVSNAKEIYLLYQELLTPKVISEPSAKIIQSEYTFDNLPISANLLGFTKTGWNPDLDGKGSYYSWNFTEGYSGTVFVSPTDQLIIVICSNLRAREFSGFVEYILYKLTE